MEDLKPRLSLAAIFIGLLILFYWRDLGATLILIGLANYILYMRDSRWTVI